MIMSSILYLPSQNSKNAIVQSENKMRNKEHVGVS